ncbi:Endo-1,4-beta-xylanase A [Paenibacillus allorhizoplanae]|uniref:Endo-1,4-beta-xylanase A n=1 Tax=Paenibacillus allorhizoplanae TaxID=2905648 RepID=A0ABM9C2C6_9BACL|nr:S-layer homology domain-containing protein [Paenibacillus allorhizoplanae]CAH1202146.1 Endo-1,4-beta-xylanase A [Paenibacillus allorhizoplanae]
MLEEIGSSAAVYDFSLMVNGKQVTNFNGNEVKVELPYTLVPGENPNKIVVYYLTDEGKLEVIKNGKYDPATGMVAFKAKHFSRYLAAYTEVSFHDLAGVKWASDAIEALAARGIVQGVGNSQFNPENQVTRAEFITMLVNAFDLKDPTATTTLADVQPSSWYYSSIASAQKLGIVNGQSSTLFGVNDRISRQDMAVMVYRTMQVMNAHSATKNTLTTFTDQASIRSYALEAVASMQQAGIIEGMDNGNFAPTSLATRAQGAVVIFRLFE